MGTAPNRRAWVIFTNQSELLCVRWLKKGFKHCFIIINDGKNWISLDPMASYMDIAVQDISLDFDLPAWLKKQGHYVIDAPLSHAPQNHTSVTIFTCVEACKRVLGIHKRTVLTPWQLYKHLLRQSFQ